MPRHSIQPESRPSRRAHFVSELHDEHPEYARTNFNTLLRAAASGDLALVECADAVTGEPRYVLAAIAHDDGTYTITPFGHLAPGNPYEAYEPPRTPPDPGEPTPAEE